MIKKCKHKFSDKWFCVYCEKSVIDIPEKDLSNVKIINIPLANIFLVITVVFYIGLCVYNNV